jgi:ComF family protein
MGTLLADSYDPYAAILRQPDTAAARGVEMLAAENGEAASPSPTRQVVGAAWRQIADFLLPPLCLHCHNPLGAHDALCANCWRGIDFIRAPLCERMGTPLPYDSGAPTVSAAALADPPDHDRARAVARFDGVIRDLVHAFKYADRHDCRRLFANWMSAAGHELLSEADLLVPVPLHRWRLLHRRYNQAAILAQQLASLRRIPWAPDALTRVKRTPQQVGLSRSQRRRNMAAAFRVAPAAQPRVDGRNIVLIDDVITTGATVEACARSLKTAGALRVDVLAVAIVTGDHVA